MKVTNRAGELALEGKAAGKPPQVNVSVLYSA